MFLDFSWVAEPTAWGGLGTLILLEVVLGIDNLVFISILSSRLPEDKRRHAFTIGLSLALIMRLGLLSTVAWLIGLTKPWFSLFGYSFTARDIILLIGGLCGGYGGINVIRKVGSERGGAHGECHCTGEEKCHYLLKFHRVYLLVCGRAAS